MPKFKLNDEVIVNDPNNFYRGRKAKVVIPCEQDSRRNPCIVELDSATGNAKISFMISEFNLTRA